MKTTLFKPEPGTANQTAQTLRDLVKRYGDTQRAARALCVSEAWIWNRLPADDREVKK
ncbi:hypothetical protein [Roseibium alexandrii]|uniref:Uncharacterized protein n=1 Tax=Roseibium alexandrii TaxID=388408 RepID=A0A0M6ZWN2_9HYPH|nr:hypothetical protein [Roseibium alexandrii]CTQ67179.1 hypothetical protein LAX5112_01251 [Roseibium alexandrii]